MPRPMLLFLRPPQIARGVPHDEVDFAGLPGGLAWRARRRAHTARVASAAAARDSEPPEIASDDASASPENLTSTQDGTVFFGSTTKGTIYRALPTSPQAEAWIRGDQAGLTNVLGVLADEKSNTLWVCDNAPFGRGAPLGGRPALRSFDLKTGKAKGAYPSPNGGVCNDVAVAADGLRTSATPSGDESGLNQAPSELDVWVADPQLRGVDGLSSWPTAPSTRIAPSTANCLRILVKEDGTAGPIAVLQTSVLVHASRRLADVRAEVAASGRRPGTVTEITIEGNRGEVRITKDGLTNAARGHCGRRDGVVLVERRKAVAVPMTAAGTQCLSARLRKKAVRGSRGSLDDLVTWCVIQAARCPADARATVWTRRTTSSFYMPTVIGRSMCKKTDKSSRVPRGTFMKA